MTLQERTAQTLKAVGVPVTVLERIVGLSSSGYYRWLKGDIKISKAKEQKIEEYVIKLERAI